MMVRLPGRGEVDTAADLAVAAVTRPDVGERLVEPPHTLGGRRLLAVVEATADAKRKRLIVVPRYFTWVA